ncbi:MAG: PAS domain S-box protein [Candidatus Riflebacteria bacterium]|nr:PAS domain S-box protein [Candidatus Riflebacteria bacterium]
MFSLLLSLFQERNLEESSPQFIAILEKLFPEIRFAFIRAGEPAPTGGFAIATPERHYGWLSITGHSALTNEQQRLLADAAKMYALILEHNEPALPPEKDQATESTPGFEELRRENEHLREREAMLARSQQIAHVGSWVLDLTINKLTWSEETYRILGINPHEFALSFTAFLGVVHPDDRAALETIYFASVREGQEGYEFEHRIIRRDNNEVRYVQEKCFHERNKDGEIVRSVGMVQDITRRKLAEEELHKAIAIAEENETRFKALHNASFGGIAIHDKGMILDCNHGLSQITGYSVDELIGMDGLLLIAEKSRDMVRANIREGYEKPYEGIGRRKNGEEFPMRLEAREIPYRGRRVRSVEFRDITEQKKAESVLAAEKERLAVTLRSIGDGVITTDTRGKVIMMNRVAEDLTGWLQQEAEGQPLDKIFRIINEKTREPAENPVEKVIASGSIIELANHTVLISKNGVELNIADSGAPIKDANSKIIGVVLVFRDMTEKQKLLDSLQRTDKLEAIGVLAGGITHDFNNLLSGIFSYIELARLVTDPKQIASYLDQALVVFDRAKNLTGQLLAFAKGGAPKRKTGDLGPVVKESAMFALSGSSITCEFEIVEDLWPADFDRGQIEQVIDNLIINAKQAMPAGGSITIRGQNYIVKDGENPLLKPGKYIRLSVADSGVGMPASLLKRIFDPFFTTKQKGNGLGLATCYAIIQKHAGMIDVESVIGEGSTFHVFIPASNNVPDTKDDSVPVSHSGHGRILIMDDEEFLRDIVGTLLREMGYQVVEAKNGEEAVKLLTEPGAPAIDAAIFDLTIPGGLGGKDAIVQVRKKLPDLVVFVSSGYSEDPVMAQPQQYGFTDSLCKPYRKTELAAMLNRYAKKQTPA